jgi:propionyl-CoA carboxylase alpha chain
LARARIHGVTTNRDLLVRILREPEFLAGATDTAYLDRHRPAALAAPLADRDAQRIHAVAAALAQQAQRRAGAEVLSRLPSGWRNNPSQPQRCVLDSRDQQVMVDYAFRRHGMHASVDGVAMDDLAVNSAEPDVVDLTVDGVRRSYQAAIHGGAVDIDSVLGATSFTVVPRFADPADAAVAGSLVAPMPGSVVRVLVDTAAVVAKGQPLVVLEAMKMEHTVTSPSDGTVAEIRVQPGQQVDAGAVLAVVNEESA